MGSSQEARSSTPAGPVAPAILIVDDNAPKRLAVRAMLAGLGHRVVEADSGRGALRAVLGQDFAVILMDVWMPVMDGYETAKLIRQRRRSRLTPIIFLTSFGRDDVETATAYASGAVDFIFAPFLPDVLQAKVTAFVELFVRTEELRRSVDAVTALNIALRDSEVRARAVVQNVADGIVTAGEHGAIESFNHSAQRMFGYGEDEVIGRPLDILLGPNHQGDVPDPGPGGQRPLTADDVATEPTETVGCRKDGSCFPMEIDTSQVRLGERLFIVACVRDISGRKAYTDALEQRSLRDDLTGLPNLALFGDRLDQAIATAARLDATCGVLVVDLDITDTGDALGNDHAEALLRAAAGRLSDVTRGIATVARLSGSEFGVLASPASDVNASAATAWTIREAFDPPLLLDDESVPVRVSIGTAFSPQHGRDGRQLVRRAARAMRQGRRSGSRLAVFATEPEDRTARRLTLLNHLREGIPNGELVLHYQPKIDLSGGRTTGVEALVRWQHPTRGLLTPSHFMPDAEFSELIEPLTRWVLDAALQQLRRWADAGLDLTMAVNISAHSLRQESELPRDLQRCMRTWSTARGAVTLELTEQAVVDAGAPGVLERLHDQGACLAIDDYGTGYSSLSYLQRLPIDEIKIDRSFVQDLDSRDADAVIVRSTIDLAHNLGLTVVAEGVEHRQALELLRSYGCDRAQGYLFSRPCPADELTPWLMDSSYGATPAVTP
jgi:diguanylate cyclase (GGDEF)-like protein/PAS domain S-box-containing protein